MLIEFIFTSHLINKYDKCKKKIDRKFLFPAYNNLPTEIISKKNTIHIVIINKNNTRRFKHGIRRLR